MKEWLIGGAFLLAGTAWAADRPLPVLVKNPTVVVQDVGAGAYAHIGQKPSQLVALGLNRTFEGRINPQTGGTTSFAVPAGFLFVLTDIQWEAPCTSGVLVHFTLVRHRPGGQSDRPVSGSTSVGCRPTVGSSKTKSALCSEVPRAAVSVTRCDSPPDSVRA